MTQVSWDMVLRAAERSLITLPSELAGYLVLGLSDQIAQSPVEFRWGDLLLDEEGRVSVGESSPTTPQAAERLVRSVLMRMLRVGGPGPTALRRVGQREELSGLHELVREIATALVPLNRAAAARAMVRLRRQVLNLAESGRLPMVEEADVPAAYPETSPGRPLPPVIAVKANPVCVERPVPVVVLTSPEHPARLGVDPEIPDLVVPSPLVRATTTGASVAVGESDHEPPLQLEVASDEDDPIIELCACDFVSLVDEDGNEDISPPSLDTVLLSDVTVVDTTVALDTEPEESFASLSPRRQLDPRRGTEPASVEQMVASFGPAPVDSSDELCRSLRHLAGLDLTPLGSVAATSTPPPAVVTDASQSSESRPTRKGPTFGGVGVFLAVALMGASLFNLRDRVVVAGAAAAMDRESQPLELVCRASARLADVPADAVVRFRQAGESPFRSVGVVEHQATLHGLHCARDLEILVERPLGLVWRRVPVQAAQLTHETAGLPLPVALGP